VAGKTKKKRSAKRKTVGREPELTRGRRKGRGSAKGGPECASGKEGEECKRPEGLAVRKKACKTSLLREWYGSQRGDCAAKKARENRAQEMTGKKNRGGWIARAREGQGLE